MTYDEAELKCYKKLLERTDLDASQRAVIKQRINTIYGRMAKSDYNEWQEHLRSIIELAAYVARRLRGNTYSYHHIKNSFYHVMYWVCDEMGVMLGTAVQMGADLMDMMDEIHDKEETK